MHEVTAPCARCESVEVYTIEQADVGQGQLVCTDCHMLLRLGFSAVESR
jgi:hypothetical protein